MNFTQDWTPVVFTKKKETRKQVPHIQGDGKKKFLENAESFEHKKIPKSIADAIKQRRLDRGLSQEKLANMINERSSVINDTEAMRGVYDHVKINKILRALGLTLKEILG